MNNNDSTQPDTKGDEQSYKFLNILRWILFIPAAVAASFFITIVSGFLLALWHEEGIFQYFVVSTYMGCIFAFTTMWIGVAIAPSHKKVAAYILGILLIAFIGMNIYASIFQKNYWQIWESVVMIFMAGYMLFKTDDEGDIHI